MLYLALIHGFPVGKQYLFGNTMTICRSEATVCRLFAVDVGDMLSVFGKYQK